MEKYQISMQAQIDAYAKQASQQENQIHALESSNCLLKDELNSMKTDNTFLLTMAKQDKQLTKELQEQIEDLNEQHRLENEQVEEKEKDGGEFVKIMILGTNGIENTSSGIRRCPR
jgi:hypothetical protein